MSETILPIETQEFLSKEIQKYNLADAKIAKLKEQFKDLKIEGVKDTENYKLVQEAIATVRPLRTVVEKKRKELNEVPLAYKKAVDDEAKRLTALLEEIENPLKEQKDFIDAEKERIKKEELERKEIIINTRIHSITDAGATFNGTHYKINDGEKELSISVVDIRNLEDEAFSIIQKTFIDAGEAIKKRIAEEQEAQRLESERIAKEKEQFEADKKALDEQRIALEKEAHRMELQKQEVAKQLYTTRAKQLQALGFNYSVANRFFEYKNNSGAYVVVEDKLSGLDSEQWNLLFQEATTERIRLNDLQVEMDKQQEAKRLENERIAKEQAEAEAQRLADEAEALRQERLPDVERVHEYIGQFSKILEVYPDIKSEDVKADFDLMYNQITGAISKFEQKYPSNEVK